MKKSSQKIGFALLLSLTLGLAPFYPEPHIWSKIKWLFGGAIVMQAMDYFDIVLHGTPWVYLVIQVIKTIKDEKRSD